MSSVRTSTDLVECVKRHTSEMVEQVIANRADEVRAAFIAKCRQELNLRDRGWLIRKLGNAL